MRATGIVRRIDDLGRVVIPKELRRSLRMNENSPLEIFTEANGEVILKKYSPIGEMAKLAEEYVEVLSVSLGHIACITDTDSIIAVAGATDKGLLHKQISPDVEKVMGSKKVTLLTEPTELTIEENHPCSSVVIAPIIADGDIVGTVIIATKESDKHMGQLEQKMAETAAGFLAKQFET